MNINARIARALIIQVRQAESELVEIMEVGDDFEATATVEEGFESITATVTVGRFQSHQLYVPKTGAPIPGSDIVTRFAVGSYYGQVTPTGALRVYRA